MAASVNFSQPLSLCEFGSPARTVSTALSSITPCFAHGMRQPLLGILQPRSVFNSLNMFISDGGGRTPGRTEKHRPCAWPSPW